MNGNVLYDCWEKDMLKQIRETTDQETICHAYLTLAEFYIDEKRGKSAEAIYARLKDSKSSSSCKSYTETAFSAYAALRPGNKASTIRAFDSNNQLIDTALIQDRGIILFFWATWCGACKQDYSDISEIHRKYSDKVVAIGISGDKDKQEFEQTLREKAVRWTNIQDGDNYDGPINRQYFVHRYPTVIVIDRHGRIITDRLRGEPLKKLISKL